MTTTRSVPWMMKVPRSVIMGKSPMNTDCSRISPVSSLMKATFMLSGAENVESVLRHSVIDLIGSPNWCSPNCTSSFSE